MDLTTAVFLLRIVSLSTGVRPDDADGAGYAGRLLDAGVLLEDFEGGDVKGQVLQPHRPPRLGGHVIVPCHVISCRRDILHR